MEKPKTIVKAENALNDIEQLKFYLKTPEQVGYVLSIIKQMKDRIEEVEDKVKTRSSEIMSDMDLKQIETDEFLICKVDPTETREYDPRVVVDAIGLERALAVGMKVSTAKIESYIKKRGVSTEELIKLNDGVKVKHRTGYIAIKAKTKK